MATIGNVLKCLMYGVLLLAVVTGCSGGGSSGVAMQASLVSIEVSPATSKIALGTDVQMKATGVYSDHSVKDLTANATWSSSDATIAKVSTTGIKGRFSSVAAGNATIKATVGTIFGSGALTVTNASLVSIGVTPVNPTLARGTSQQFTATGIFSDGTTETTQDLTSQVTWNSSSASVSISNAAGANGLATAVSAGSANVTATLAGSAVTGGTLVTVTTANLVSIEVTPALPIIVKGSTQQFHATALFDDNSKQDVTATVAWSSVTPAVASVTSGGLATGLTVGTTIVKATSGAISGSATLSVNAPTLLAIELQPNAPSIALGTSQQFTAIGRFSDNSTLDLTSQATWASSNTGFATVSNAAGANGLASAVATGATTISATFGGVTGSTLLTVTSAQLVSIDVQPAIPSMPAGVQQAFTATGTFTDNSTQDLTNLVVWTSDTPGVATISNVAGANGLAFSVTPGTATITATLGTMSGSTVLTVTTATLTAIEVDPPAVSIPKGLTEQYSATATFSDGSLFDVTPQVTWGSSAHDIATVSNDAATAGLATTFSAGSTTITATLNGISGSTTLTVLPVTLQSIAVTPANGSIALGTTQQFVATGTYTNNVTQDLTQFVTWVSSDPTVANISNTKLQKGVASGLKAGTTTITAAFGATVSPGVTFTVTNATLQSITIAPAAATMATRTTQQFTATGHFNDGTTEDLTNLATWSTDAPTIANVSNATRTKGVATAFLAGGTTIRASFRDQTGTTLTGNTTITVVTATLTGIVIRPLNPIVTVGLSQQLQALGVFNGGAFQQDITRTCKWSSTNAQVALFNNGFYKRGIATAVSAGTCTVSATRSGLTGSTGFTAQ